MAVRDLAEIEKLPSVGFDCARQMGDMIFLRKRKLPKKFNSFLQSLKVI